MRLTRIAAIFALTTSLAACATLPAGRDFNTLTVGEKTDFSLCVFEKAGSKLAARGDTPGSVLDNLLATPGKMQDATSSALNRCALQMWVNPNTVPGLRP